MKRKLWPLLSLAILLFSPNWIFADCVGLEHSTSWVVEDEKKIIFYRGQQPLAVIVFQDCNIPPNSKVRFIKSYVCDSDKIIINDQECTILEIKSSAF
jgi:hypothetical protein